MPSIRDQNKKIIHSLFLSPLPSSFLFAEKEEKKTFDIFSLSTAAAASSSSFSRSDREIQCLSFFSQFTDTWHDCSNLSTSVSIYVIVKHFFISFKRLRQWMSSASLEWRRQQRMILSKHNVRHLFDHLISNHDHRTGGDGSLRFIVSWSSSNPFDHRKFTETNENSKWLQKLPPLTLCVSPTSFCLSCFFSNKRKVDMNSKSLLLNKDRRLISSKTGHYITWHILWVNGISSDGEVWSTDYCHDVVFFLRSLTE